MFVGDGPLYVSEACAEAAEGFGLLVPPVFAVGFELRPLRSQPGFLLAKRLEVRVSLLPFRPSLLGVGTRSIECSEPLLEALQLPLRAWKVDRGKVNLDQGLEQVQCLPSLLGL